MAMKRRPEEQQASLWIAHEEMVTSPGHPFYEKLDGIIVDEGFDTYRQPRTPTVGGSRVTVESD